MRVLGVDGCRGGWVAALVDVDTGAVSWHLLPDAAAVVAVAADVTAVDIPMGLPDRGPRRCDQAARAALGPARSSVFPAPPRPLVAQPRRSYAETLAWSRAQGLGGLSAQAHGILDRVRDVDAVLSPAVQERVLEVHPELSFRRLAGKPVLASKKSATGVGQRLRALQRWLPEVAAALADDRLARIGVDDALDALGCAWTAHCFARGDAGPVGGAADVDARGLLMRIVV